MNGKGSGMKSWKTWSGLTVIFLSGILIGVVGSGLYFNYTMKSFRGHGPAGIKRLVMKKLSRELDLSRDQQASIREIVGRTVDDLDKLRRKHRPEIEAVVSQGVASIKPYLNPDQQRKLDEMYERFKKRGGPPPPGPPPPEPPGQDQSGSPSGSRSGIS
jgi:hypothetical protein